MGLHNTYIKYEDLMNIFTQIKLYYETNNFEKKSFRIKV